VIGKYGADRQAGENGKLPGQCGGAGFKMQPRQLEVGGGKAGLEQIEVGVDAGLGALLLDAHQVDGEILLLLCGGDLPAHGIQLDVGGGGVESHLFACVLEAQIGGVNAGAGGFHVLALRVAEDQRLEALPTEG